MAEKHLQLLRKGGFTSFEGAKTAILNKLQTTLNGEPVIVYYKDNAEATTTHIIFGIGGTSGQSVFYNAEVTDSLLSKLQETLSGSTTDALSAKLTLHALKNKIEGLDFSEIGSSTAGSRKVINTIKETDGLISATTIDLSASNIDATAISASDSTVAVTGSTVSDQIASLGKSIKSLDNSTLTYKTVAITGDSLTALGANVLEAYKTVSVNASNVETQVGDIIKIYKDQRLASMSYSGQILTYTYEDASGATKTVNIDMSELVQEAEVENGIQQSNHKLSVKVNSSTETDSNGNAFLTVGSNGVNVSGIKHEIDGKINALDSVVSASTYGITATVNEEDGKLTCISLGVQHPTITWTNSSTHTINVTNPDRVVLGSDLTGIETYVRDYIASTAIYASGDTYVRAVVDSGNIENNANKKINITAQIADVIVNSGTVGNWTVTDNGIATKTGEQTPNITGISGTLLDSANAISAIKTYIDKKIEIESAERTAKIAASIKSLDSSLTSIVDNNSSNVKITVGITDGKITELSGKIDVFDAGEWE